MQTLSVLLVDLLLQCFYSLVETKLEQVLKNAAVDVLLTCRELIKVDERSG